MRLPAEKIESEYSVGHGECLDIYQLANSYPINGMLSKSREEFAKADAPVMYITAAYWFTASTSFANPAVAIARSLTSTFAGIRPVDLPVFIVAELIGALAGLLLMAWLLGRPVVRGPVQIAKTTT